MAVGSDALWPARTVDLPSGVLAVIDTWTDSWIVCQPSTRRVESCSGKYYVSSVPLMSTTNTSNLHIICRTCSFLFVAFTFNIAYNQTSVLIFFSFSSPFGMCGLILTFVASKVLDLLYAFHWSYVYSGIVLSQCGSCLDLLLMICWSCYSLFSCSLSSCIIVYFFIFVHYYFICVELSWRLIIAESTCCKCVYVFAVGSFLYPPLINDGS